MSTTFTGNTPIAASTNASPIEVTTSSPHQLTTGAVVQIAGHLVNTAANGLWTITVVDGTHFTLNSSTGNGVGGATGAVYVYAASFPVPSDGDSSSAASVATALQALGLRTEWLTKRAVTKYEVWTSSGNSTVPPWAFAAILIGQGGGGQGGGGGFTDTFTDQYSPGGGGGGGSLREIRIVHVTPGDVNAVVVGAGGTGAGAGASTTAGGGVGASGGDTTYAGQIVSRGAGGGFGGAGSSDTSNVAMGGLPVSPMSDQIISRGTNGNGTIGANTVWLKQPGQGGCGLTNGGIVQNAAGKGAGNPSSSFSGGVVGAAGTNDGSYRGGGGGGGGAAGPNGGGGNGGDASNGQNGGAAGLGGPGNDAVANSGAGGGGGGGGGAGSVSGGVGGSGGSGGSGRLDVIYIGGISS